MKKIKTLMVVTLLIISGKITAQYLGQIMWVPYNFAPRGWAECKGQIVPISQYTALFALIGTKFGGDGSTTFALPNMQGRTMIGESAIYPGGTASGEASVTLLTSQIPSHTHQVTASKALGDQNLPTSNYPADTKVGDPEYSDATANTVMATQVITPSGGGQAHNNMQPYTSLKCVIALQGTFPPRP